MNKIDVTVPRKIWAGDHHEFRRWCWETYGRYIDKSQPVEIKLRFRWF